MLLCLNVAVHQDLLPCQRRHAASRCRHFQPMRLRCRARGRRILGERERPGRQIGQRMSAGHLARCACHNFQIGSLHQSRNSCARRMPVSKDTLAMSPKRPSADCLTARYLRMFSGSCSTRLSEFLFVPEALQGLFSEMETKHHDTSPHVPRRPMSSIPVWISIEIGCVVPLGKRTRPALA